jgi:curved DNA-binding protein CbpA
VTLKNYYDLLNIEPTASAEDVKRAFRQQISRYHPDKVQHLGVEFQGLAADRAAELTEAYRVLSEPGRRAEYDQTRKAAGGQRPDAAVIRPDAVSEAKVPPPEPSFAGPTSSASESDRFGRERAGRDEFVRRVTMDRLRQALDAVKGNAYDACEVKGFDIACVPKPKLFGRNKNPRLLGRFASPVDAAAVAEAWTRAAKWNTSSNDEVCVLLMGSPVTSRRELEGAIAAQRRKAGPGGKVTLIPIDSRDWSAYIPTDAPVLAKNLLARIRGDA